MKQLLKGGLRRRRFLKGVPAAVAGGLAMPALAQPPARSRRARIGKACSSAARNLRRRLHRRRREMALNRVNRNLESFEQLRKLDVPLDTEPAITFRPYLPGQEAEGRARRQAQS